MSTLTLNMEWLEPIGDPQQVADIKVFCSDVVVDVRFVPDDSGIEQIETSGICTVTPEMTTSDVVVASDCEGYLNLSTQDVACNLTAAGMYTGVPLLGGHGLTLLGATVLTVGLWHLFKR